MESHFSVADEIQTHSGEGNRKLLEHGPASPPPLQTLSPHDYTEDRQKLNQSARSIVQPASAFAGSPPFGSSTTGHDTSDPCPMSDNIIRRGHNNDEITRSLASLAINYDEESNSIFYRSVRKHTGRNPYCDYNDYGRFAQEEEDDSLLQYPLSVCTSRIGSTLDICESSPAGVLEYPVCCLGTSDDSVSPQMRLSTIDYIDKTETQKQSVNLITSPQTVDAAYLQETTSTTILDSNAFNPILSDTACVIGYSDSESEEERHGTEGVSFDDQHSLTPAPSIGAISAITGVSFFDDDDDADRDTDDKSHLVRRADESGLIQDIGTEAKYESVIQNVGSNDLFSERPRAHSESLVMATPQKNDNIVNVLLKHCKASVSPERKRRIRTRYGSQRHFIPKRKNINTLPRPNSDLVSNNGTVPLQPAVKRPLWSLLRKKLVPPYHDPSFHLAKELSMTERTYVKGLRMLLMPCWEESQGGASSVPVTEADSRICPSEQINDVLFQLVSPIYEVHVALATAAFARLVAWEKAAVAAAAARTRYQFALARLHQEQRRHREIMARRLVQQAAASAVARRQSLCAENNDDAARSLSDSSNSVSGIPRSASTRQDFPTNLMLESQNFSISSSSVASSLSPSRSGSRIQDLSLNSCPCNSASRRSPTASSSSPLASEQLYRSQRSSRAWRLRHKHQYHHHRRNHKLGLATFSNDSPVRHQELPAAESELRDTTRRLVELARIADVYQLLLSALPSYEVLMSQFMSFISDTLKAPIDYSDGRSLDSVEVDVTPPSSPPPLADIESGVEKSAPSNGIGPAPSRQLLLRLPGRRLRCLLLAFINLLSTYAEDHPDRRNCTILMTELQKLISKTETIYRASEAYLLSAEFCCDLRVAPLSLRCISSSANAGFLPLSAVSDAPNLIRVGFLEKFSKHGVQPRIVLLFSDRIVCCSRVSGCQTVQLKFHGSIPLTKARVEPHVVSLASFADGAWSFPELVDLHELESAPVPVPNVNSKTCRNRKLASSESLRRKTHGFTILTTATMDDVTGDHSAPEDCSRVNRTFALPKMMLTDKSTSLFNSDPQARRMRRVVFAAPSDSQKKLWLADISRAISEIENASSDKCNQDGREGKMEVARCWQYSFSTGEIDSQQEVATEPSSAHLGLLGPRSHVQQTLLRCHPLLYVCWHRRLTVSLESVLNANECELSGHLLRKFKNSCGWQKLWTVFTDFTLYFYKSADDVTPLASLPLLGYCLEPARASDHDLQVHKSDVLRLSYKSQVYFFRTDGPISFKRWFTALSSALHFLSVVKQYPDMN